MLKLFPVFAGAFLVRLERTLLLKLGAISLIVIGIYTFGTLEDILFISEVTPKGSFLSYGTNVFPLALQDVDLMLAHYVKIATVILTRSLSHLLLMVTWPRSGHSRQRPFSHRCV